MDTLSQNFIKIFSSPPDVYRAKPFWSWNSLLDETTLIKQIHQLKQMGISGALVHSRSGLATEYLGEKWFELVNAVCGEAAKNNFTIWIYDEDRWPSGTAGGKVTSQPAYRQKRLVIKISKLKDFVYDDTLTAVFSGKINGREIENYAPIHNDSSLEGLPEDTDIISFKMQTMPCTDWYNGGAYLDTLDADSVKAFINSTHEKYRRHCGNYFGSVITTVFTDEPHHESVLAPTIFSVQNNSSDASKDYEIPWTATLADFFREKYGYDILEHLPLILFDAPGRIANIHRHNYHDCITSMFTKAYAAQIADWAKSCGLQDTGHVFWESPLNKMVSYVGSVMRFMEYVQMPCVDILSTRAVFTGGRNEYDSVKQCTSIANQFSKPNVLSETYACCGWEFTPREMKRIGDWQAVLGINTRCQSCFAYTTENDGKRDFPPSYFNVPWRDMFASIEDYYARINAFISIGRPLRRVLVIHPNETIWQLIKADWTDTKEYDAIEAGYENLMLWLLQSQIDFDYGDEEIMSRKAKVCAANGRPQIRLADALYDCVIVPALITIRQSTARLLEEFADKGGKVIFTGGIPAHVDAAPSQTPAAIAEKCTCVKHDKDDIIAALADVKDVIVSVKSQSLKQSDILCTIKEQRDSKFVILHNTAARDGQIELVLNAGIAENAAVIEANPFTGRFETIKSARVQNKIRFTINIAARELRLFVITTGDAAEPRQEIEYKNRRTAKCDNFSISLQSPNVCMLDNAQYGINGEKPNHDYLYNADIEIRRRMGWPQRRFNMLQPWADKDWHGKKSVNVKISYAVKFDAIPSQLSLAMERPERFAVTFNGTPVTPQYSEYFIDHSIKTMPVNVAIIKEGVNIIEMNIDYRKSDGLENIFLLGDFAVRLDNGMPVIAAGSTLKGYCDLTENGSPFYCGFVKYSGKIKAQKHQKAILSVPQWNGAAIDVVINGKNAGRIAFMPYELDITGFLQDGENSVELILSSTSRNFFGPFHCAKPFRGEGWTDPRDYACPAFKKENGYSLIPLGITAAPQIIYSN